MIRYSPAVLMVLAAAFALTMLTITRPTKSAIAADPTPTPGTTAVTGSLTIGASLLCNLEVGQDCTFINPLAVAIRSAGFRTYPAIGARDVPTYTLVSVTFDAEMDPSSITNDTFYLEQGPHRISGAIDYINAGRMAIFFPDSPLLMNTIYTATMTAAVLDLLGMPLKEDIVWTFTTSSGGGAPSGNGLIPVGVPLLDDNMNIYFGDLHGHTGYSDGHGTPADAFTMARAIGLDFYGLTEHAFMLTEAEWQDVLSQANVATTDGQFVALPGFEFTHAKGHINVFGSDTYIHRDDPRYQSLEDFYAWLVAQPTAIGQFNHPNGQFDFNFNNFSFNAAADQKMVLQELTTADQFFLSLNSGWHLGTLKNRDTHTNNWGCCPLMGVVASSLTKAGILGALGARRTFFVSPDDSNLAVTMKANGYWMGSAIPNTTLINFTITAHDPDPTGKPLRLILYDQGIPVASTTLPSTTWYSWSPAVSGTLGHYYYVGVYYDDWWYAAYSSPIWVERSPVAKARAAQAVAPGASVTLDGSESWDPDGDVLAYQWFQESGPAVNLEFENSAQPSFTAPVPLGELTFRLTVADTGSLTDVDTVTVTVTDKPILSVVKRGPASTEPGQPILYTLTVTNTGVRDAIGVTITDVVPMGATHMSGGTLMPNNVISWTVPSIASNGGVVQESFMVAASGGVINKDYRASCPDCIAATGEVAVATNLRTIYLPTVQKN